MKKLLFAIILLFISAPAFAQCNGIFPNNTVCGNITGAGNLPRPTAPSAFLGAGGTNGQIQYNNSGALGGFTLSGSCTISVIATGLILCPGLPGYTSMEPNQANIGSGPVNQIVSKGDGTPINVIGSSTGGLSEMDTYSANIGEPMTVVQRGTPGTGPTTQYIGISQTWTTKPRGIWYTDILDATINCVMVDGSSCIILDSAEIGWWRYIGQIVYNSTGAAMDWRETTQTPNDHFKNWSLNFFWLNTCVATTGLSDACIRFNLAQGATDSFGVIQNEFHMHEINGGNYGIRVTNPPNGTGGVHPSYHHNILSATTIHGQGLAGVRVGNDGSGCANQQYLNGNMWTALFTSNSATDAFVTCERNSLIIYGADADTLTTNGLHYESGATNNLGLILDNVGPTIKLVDDNTIGTGGNLTIGNGDIVFQGYSILGAWKTYTPSVSCTGGSAPTFANLVGHYNVMGKKATVTIRGNVSAVGSCTGNMSFSMPVAALASGIPVQPATGLNSSSNTTFTALVNGSSMFMIFSPGPGVNDYIATSTFELN